MVWLVKEGFLGILFILILGYNEWKKASDD